MQFSFSLRDFLLGVAVTAVFGAFGAAHLNSKIAKFETAVATADSARALVEQDSKRLLGTVERQSAAIDSLVAANDRSRALLAASRRQVAAAEAQLASLDAAVQRDSACWRLCQPSIAARDTIIEMTSAQRDSAFFGWQRSDSALSSTTVVLDSAKAVIAKQDTVIRAYQHAVDLAPTTSTFWEKLKPDVGVGLWAGYDMAYHGFGYGFAATFDWSLF